MNSEPYRLKSLQALLNVTKNHLNHYKKELESSELSTTKKYLILRIKASETEIKKIESELTENLTYQLKPRCPHCYTENLDFNYIEKYNNIRTFKCSNCEKEFDAEYETKVIYNTIKESS